LFTPSGKYEDDGMAPIKEIVYCFQYLPNIDLGNNPRVYQELLSLLKSESYFFNLLVND
jgi:hypothetical protein